MVKLFLKSEEEHKVTSYFSAQTLLRQEFIAYNALTVNTHLLRNSFLKDLANAKDAESGMRQSSTLKQLQLRERQRELGRKIKFILRKNKVGLTTVEAPNEEGEWITVTGKVAIESGCFQENIRRFTQANTTPSLVRDQIEHLGWTGNGTGSNDILQGHPTDALHPDILALAEFLSVPAAITELGTIRCTISTEEFQREWKRCKEFTSSGISTVHFGHFKASCTNTITTEVDRWFAEMSLQYGYSLTRWQKGIDVMIPKKEDSIRVDKLRTIVLVEADFNFINKIAAKRTMIQAETAGTVAEEQFGSRKQKKFYSSCSQQIDHARNIETEKTK